MNRPFLIIVTGRPAAGKSTLASWLSQELSLPLVSKDTIREILFERLGWGERPWAQKLGVVSIDLMFHFAETQLRSGHSLIMDNAFAPQLSAPQFLSLIKSTESVPIQIVCNAPSKILFDRFVSRAKEGKRHPGHGDKAAEETLWQSLQRETPPTINLGGKIIAVDTTDFTHLDYTKIAAEVMAYKNGYTKNG